MKANPWLLPGVAMLATGSWFAIERQSASALEREISVITSRIHLVRSAGADGAGTQGLADKARKDKDGKINWKDLSTKVTQMRSGGMPDMRAMMRIQRLLMDMSAAELGTQLDEISALDIDDAAKKQLQGMIIGALAEKDPKMVMERFSGEAADDNSPARWYLQMAMGKWAQKDPAAASAWLDRQIADGKFESKSLDGKNQDLLRFEGALVNALLKSDPTAASTRVAAIPEDQRVDFFHQGFFFQVAPGSEAAYAKLVRDNLPSDKVGSVLAETAGNLSLQGGYERVDGFISSAHASDAERKSIVSQVMETKLGSNGGSSINAADLDKARAWAATQSPGVVDSATGEALASSIWRGGNFKDASALALQYNEKGSNDEVLVSFLKSGQVRNTPADQVMPLIDRIKDPAVREEIRALPEFKK